MLGVARLGPNSFFRVSFFFLSTLSKWALLIIYEKLSFATETVVRFFNEPCSSCRNLTRVFSSSSEWVCFHVCSTTRNFKLGTRRILQLQRSGTLIEDEESISEEASWSREKAPKKFHTKGNHRGVIDPMAAAIMGRTGRKRDGYSSCMLRFTALYTVLAALSMVRSTVYAQCDQQSLLASSAPFSPLNNFTCQNAFSQQAAWVCLSLSFPLSFSLCLMCPFPHSPLLLASRMYDH